MNTRATEFCNGGKVYIDEMIKLEQSYFNIFDNRRKKGFEENKLQNKLNLYYKQLMADPKYYKDIPDKIDDVINIRAIENAWSRHLDSSINQPLARTKSEFKSWYKEAYERYSCLARPFFEYFSNEGSLQALALYLKYEQDVDGSFDDIVSLAQIGLQGNSKMVLAENYWDEMGNGNNSDVHTLMFSESVQRLNELMVKSGAIFSQATIIPTEILANGNMLLMYANRRKFIPRLLGAIGILEDTAPERFKATVKLMKRLNLPPEILRYHEVHISCDCRHGLDILEHVLVPYVMSSDDDFLSEVCKGVLVRINVAIEYYGAMKSVFDSVIKHKE